MRISEVLNTMAQSTTTRLPFFISIIFAAAVLALVIASNVGATTTTITDFSSGTCTNCTNQASGVMLANSISTLADLQSVISTTGLQLFYPFNKNDSNSTFTTDYSANARNGVVISATLNYSYYQFSGNGNSMITINNISAPNFTISFWYNPLNMSLKKSTYRYICQDAYNANNTWCIYLDTQYTNNKSQLLFLNSTGTTYTPLSLTPIYNAWNFIVATYDGKTLTYYSSPSDYTSMNVSNFTALNSSISIGGYRTNVSLDNVLIMNKAITLSDVSSLFSKSLYLSEGNYVTPIFNITSGSTAQYIYNATVTCNSCSNSGNISISARTSLDNITWTGWSNYILVSGTTARLYPSTTPGNYVQFSIKSITTSFNSTPELIGYTWMNGNISPYLLVSITSNLSKPIALINNYFYGTNTHGIWGSQGTIIYNNSGISIGISNYSWHRQMIQQDNLNYLRADMFMDRISNGYKTYYSSYNLISQQDMVEWANNNSMKILYVIENMPYWLANRSDLCSQDMTNTSYVVSCPPTNYTQWGDIVVDSINQVTQNGKYNSTIEIEIYNEPYNDWWLHNTTDMTIRSAIYFKFFNFTYNAIKTKYPNIQIGGPSGTFYSAGNNSQAQSFTNGFLNLINVTNTPIDFVTIHEYSDSVLIGTRGASNKFTDAINNVRMNYTTLKNIPIYFSEWNDANATDNVNNTGLLNNLIGQSYISLLTNNNTRSIMYQWSEQRNWTASNTNSYPSFPNRYEMVSELLLSNSLFIPYNITKQFSSSHRAGDTVINSTSDYGNLVVVASRYQGRGAVTVVNKDTNALNVTLNLNSVGINSLTSYTGTSLTGSSGVFQLGLVQPSEVDTYNFTYTRTLALDGCDEYLPNYPINFTTLYCNNSDITFSFGASQISINSSDSQSLNFSGLVTPYNDIYNVSNGIVLAYNQNSYNMTLSPGQQVNVGNYKCFPQGANTNFAVNISNNCTKDSFRISSGNITVYGDNGVFIFTNMSSADYQNLYLTCTNCKCINCKTII